MKINHCLFPSAVAVLVAFGVQSTPTTSTGAANHAVMVQPSDHDPQDPVKKPAVAPKFDMAQLKALFGSDPVAPKSDNEVTPAKVALGKALYHDKSLSKNGNLACASCHDLANYGQDGKPTSPGSEGKNGTRNSPTTVNAFRQIAQFWDGRAATVEEQAIMPVLNPVEHGVADEAELVKKLKASESLVKGFGEAFPGQPDAVTVANFKLAIGAFERTLVTKSPFDEFLDGKNNALNASQKRGLKAFIDVGCITCHTTRLLGGHLYQKLGTMRPYPSKDEGRFAITKNEADKFLFKVPTLLNIAKTAPYLHDGSIATLAETVKMMAQVQLNKDLKDEEVASIIEFLETLTGPLPENVAVK